MSGSKCHMNFLECITMLNDADSWMDVLLCSQGESLEIICNVRVMHHLNLTCATVFALERAQS